MGDVAASAVAGLLPSKGGEDERESELTLRRRHKGERDCTSVPITYSAVSMGFAFCLASSVGGGTSLDPLSLLKSWVRSMRVARYARCCSSS